MYSFYLLGGLLFISAAGVSGFILSFEISRKIIKKIIQRLANWQIFSQKNRSFRRTEPILTVHNKELAPSQKIDRPTTFQEELVVLYLMAPDNQPYKGYALWEALNSQNLVHDPKTKIFHFYSDNTILFSIASAAEPGYLVSHSISSVHVSGLCLFTNPTPTIHPLDAFKKMLSVSKRLEHLLGGTLHDSYHEPLSETSLHEYYYRLSRLKTAHTTHA